MYSMVEVMNPGALRIGCDCIDMLSEECGAEVEREHAAIPSDSVEVQGRLRKSSSFWRDTLRASDYVFSIVTSGYKLPFVQWPEPVFLENYNMSESERLFVTEAIQELVDNNCAAEVCTPPLVCSPLQVVARDGGKRRLVIDLRYVNQYLHKFKFKYEGLDVATQLLEDCSWMTTFDLKSGYHHINIHPVYQQYLGFSWRKDGERIYYVFRVLPFGLATACYVFTKVLRPLVSRWRSKGVKMVLYIDDGICVAKSRELALKHTLLIEDDLSRAGFVLNKKKSQLTPASSGRWLGVEVDLRQGVFSIPVERIEKLRNAIARLLSSGLASARSLAKVTGQVLSMSIAVGPVTRLRTRALYEMINSRLFWNQLLQITDDAREELLFWLCSAEALNGRSFCWKPSATRVAYSDASGTGYGGFVVELGPHAVSGCWSEDEARQSSTWRELKAVDRVLESVADKLSSHTIKWYTDNQSVVRIIQHGSRKSYLQDGAMCIYERCIRHGVRLEMAWVPRCANQHADYLSRIVDYDDWQMDPSVFLWLNGLWGPFSVDNFADHRNTQLPRFHSRFWCPGSEAVDTFSTSWEGEMNWVVPPVYLVARVIQHAKVCRAKGCMLIPAWESAYFWPLIVPDGLHLADFVHSWCWLPYYEGMLLSGLSGTNIASTMNCESCFLALLFDFAVYPRFPFAHPAFRLY